MIDQLHWSNDPVGNMRATAFFRQHPRGVLSYGMKTTPGMPAKYANEEGTPGQAYFVVVTGDNVSRWCSAGKHWTFDGRRFAAEVCTDACGQEPCSYPGCGKPTAYLTHRDGSGAGWRHVADEDECPSHVGYPMARG